MGIISWIVFGLIAGVIAKIIMPGRDPGGCVITMLLGVVGAFVGGFLYEFFTGVPQYTRFDIPSLLTAIVGALVVLLVYRLIVGRRA